MNKLYYDVKEKKRKKYVIYLPLTGLMSRYTTPFTKRVVNKYGSVCPCYQSFFYGTLHMRARIDEEHNYKEKMFTFQTWKKYSNSNSNSNIYWIKHINVVKYMTYIIITMLRNPIHSQKSSIYINIEITHNIIILSLQIRL